MLTESNVMGIVYAVVATGTLVALLALLRRIFNRFDTRVEAELAHADWALEIRRLKLLSAEDVKRGVTWTIRVIHTLSVLIVIYLYIPVVLMLFPWTEPLARPLVDYFVEPLKQIWKEIVDYTPSLLLILVIVFFTWLILKLLRGLFIAVRTGYIRFPGFYVEWAVPTYKLIRFLVLALTLAVIVPLLPGAASPAFKGISLFVGAMVTLGSTGAMGNVAAGVVLIYTRSFNVGDYVKIGDAFGQVIERTLLATRLQTPKYENVTIPNSAALSSHVVNYSATSDSPDLVVHTAIGLGYDIDWRKVHELLKNAANKTEYLETHPEPFVLQKSLDDFSVSYEINARTKRPDLLPVIYSELNRNILDEFSREQIEIMSPRYTAVRDGNALAVPKTES
jgi:small-conductance mechanosensitive channel